jgi:hypothetical protein
MHTEKSNNERRRFLKHALGIGAIVWLTPAIISVSARKGHACLSGYNSKRDGCRDNFRERGRDKGRRWWR